MSAVFGRFEGAEEAPHFVLQCGVCGVDLDELPGREVPAYVAYVGRTHDAAFCEWCDEREDVVHPYVAAYSGEVMRHSVYFGVVRPSLWAPEDPACLLIHNSTENA